jgi:hypothetical protein
MTPPLNNSHPQYGVVMHVSGNQAQLYIPLWGAETGMLPSCVVLDETMVGREVVVIFVNGDRNQGVVAGVIQNG